MKELLEALNIFAKYMEDVDFPTHCEHDILYIMLTDEFAPTPEETTRLEKLGFFFASEVGCWASYKFGSA